MPLLARKSVLAIAAVTEIAVHGSKRPVTAKALASRYGLPARHLETVLQALVRHGILKGIRGPRGGYELARERGRISADQILRAAANADDEVISSAGSQLLDEVVKPAISQAEHAFSAALARISVEDLTQSAQGLRKAS
jgi:Rrf2 family protein